MHKIPSECLPLEPVPNIQVESTQTRMNKIKWNKEGKAKNQI